jgi:hypothetical protein
VPRPIREKKELLHAFFEHTGKIKNPDRSSRSGEVESALRLSSPITSDGLSPSQNGIPF